MYIERQLEKKFIAVSEEYACCLLYTSSISHRVYEHLGGRTVEIHTLQPAT